MERVLVGVDGSEGSALALRWAVRHARAVGGALTVVLAYRHEEMVGPPGARWPVESREAVHERARAELDALLAAELGDDTGLEVRADVVYGSPAEVLLDRAATADLLVVGSRGRGGFKGLLLGSVSQHVSQHAPCPVTIVPTPR